jgi:histidyl-tRNA synthetase
MSQGNTTPRPQARIAKGFRDIEAAELSGLNEMLTKIRGVYERYGFEALETPAIEYTDALGKFLPDQDRPNAGVFSFQDEDEQWMSLRYDLTAPLARYVAQNYQTLPKPFRRYAFGNVYRNEKPGPGRFRQFMQFDADTVGADSVAADAEMCMMAADTMEALGIPRGSYVVKVNNRKVLDGVMESIGLSGEEHAGTRLTVLRAIDKLDKFPVEEIEKLLGPGRWDGGEEGKGDFTKGAGLSDRGISRVINFTGYKGQSGSKSDVGSNAVTIANFGSVVEDNTLGKEGVAELTIIKELVAAAGYDESRIVIDPSVVRGLEYYTGPVYEVELTLETKDEKGRPVRFGSVGGGGRYDGLVSRFRGEPAPATGFSIGVSRLQAALTMLGKLDTRPEFGPVVVTVFDRDRVADYQKMVAELRNANIRAELYLGNPKNMGNQLKYADRRNSPCVIIQGSDEKARGEVQIKDLIEGAKAAAAIASNQEWRETRPAQFSCGESEIIARVREVLARHDVKWGN